MDWRLIKALEKRLAWLRWATSESAMRKVMLQDKIAANMYIRSLSRGETYYMNEQFCSLVDHARRSIPDNLLWDNAWFQSKAGWLYIETPFGIPKLDKKFLAEEEEKAKQMGDSLADTIKAMKISAVSWFDASGLETNSGILPEGTFQFLMYEDMAQFFNVLHEEGFGMWSYFRLKDGDKLIDRLHEFENATANPNAPVQYVFDHRTGKFEPHVGSGVYEKTRETEETHEMRWTYAAFHLMAQRLAMTVQHPFERQTRKRLHTPEIPPFIRIVTLRRMEQHRKEAGADIDWKWQWTVRGHWRDQWYPSKKIHQPVFIESYIKGPEDKPLKPPTHTIFKAER